MKRVKVVDNKTLLRVLFLKTGYAVEYDGENEEQGTSDVLDVLKSK